MKSLSSLSLSPIPTRATCMYVYACACDRWGKEERSLPIGTPPGIWVVWANGNSRHCQDSLFCLSEYEASQSRGFSYNVSQLLQLSDARKLCL